MLCTLAKPNYSADVNERSQSAGANGCRAIEMLAAQECHRQTDEPCADSEFTQHNKILSDMKIWIFSMKKESEYKSYTTRRQKPTKNGV